MVELAHDSPGYNATYKTASAIDTATNKLIIFRVWNYVNGTTQYASFCAFSILLAKCQ